MMILNRSVVSSVLMTFLTIILAGSVPAQVKETAGKGKDEKKMPAPQGKEYAIVETSKGTFEIELYRSDAPKTVENFVKLAEKKYFDGMRFHRISKNFVIQTGDDKSKDPAKMQEWGTGGKSIWGKEFEDELNPKSPSGKEGYRKGVVAMANRGPNTNTSQFFVMLRDNLSLPYNYTIFGKVVKGLDVVDAIGNVEIVPLMGPSDGRPKEDVLMKKVTIRREGEPKAAPAEKK